MSTEPCILTTTISEMNLLRWEAYPPAMMMDCHLTPDDWQSAVLLSTSTRILMVCSRQCGKSTTVACMGIHTAVCFPDSLVLCFSPSLRQSHELYIKMRGMYRDLGRPIPAVQESATTLDLANGSRIVSLPGSHETIRGFSRPSLIIVDEACQVNDSLFVGAMPMLAASPGGRLVLLSSPFGQRGICSSNSQVIIRSGRDTKLPLNSVPESALNSWKSKR